MDNILKYAILFISDKKKEFECVNTKRFILMSRGTKWGYFND